MTEISELEKCYIKLSKTAWKRSQETTKFHKLCQENYGFAFDEIDELKDDSRIIDTIYYGTDCLRFSDFEKMMLRAKKKAIA